jgi:hypothetical protein
MAIFRRSHVRSTLIGAGRLDLHIVFGTGLTLLDTYSHHIQKTEATWSYSGVYSR